MKTKLLTIVIFIAIGMSSISAQNKDFTNTGLPDNYVTKATWNPKHPSWTDSYSANGFCWCNSTFDHDLGNINKVWFEINGVKRNIKDVCDELKKHPEYRFYKNGDAPYNDIQCGNGPANTAADEKGCPGRTDLGSSGCWNKGPKWDVTWLKSRPRFGGNNNGGGNTGDAPIGSTIWLKASNGKYVCAERNITNSPLECDRSAVGGWEKYTVENAGGGYISLKALANGNYVCADKGLNGTNPPLAANRTKVGSWEKFTWVKIADNKVALKALANGKFVQTVNSGDTPLKAISGSSSNLATFTWGTTTKSAIGSNKISSVAFSASVYPNPVTNGIATVKLNMASASDVSINIVDFAGKTVYSDNMGALEVGMYAFELNVADFKMQHSGLYIIQIKAGDKVEHHKIMVSE